MVKINGVKAHNTFETNKQKEIKPTINEILDRMENNYQSSQSGQFNNQQNASLKSEDNRSLNSKLFNNSGLGNGTSTNINSNLEENQSSNGIFNQVASALVNTPPNNNDFKGGFNNDNLLLSILPMMLSKNKSVNTLKNSENIIFKEILKNSNNPRLMQIAELLPKILSHSKTSSIFNATEETKKITELPKIDTFKKTNEYED